ncbi:MAG: hypothetical protein ACR2ML_13325 [Solirubrobacteraceae bacterium]
MTDEEKPSGRSGSASSGGDVISNLPRHRPHRRSDKRRASGPASGAQPDAGHPSTATATAKAERSGGRAATGGNAAARSKGELRDRKPASPSASRPSAKAGGKAAAPTAPRSARERIGRTASAKTRAPTPPAELKAGREREARRPEDPSAELPGGPSSGTELVGTVVQAAGELAQIGLTLGTQAVKNAVKRLPKP